jgi:hypothetical protein
MSGSVWFRAQFWVVPEDREALVLETVTCDPGSELAQLHRQELGVKSRQFALEVIKSLSYFIMCQVLDTQSLNQLEIMIHVRTARYDRVSRVFK